MTSPPLEPATSTADGLDAAWKELGRTGTWWTASERLAIAREARAARTCPLCAARKAALSPYAVEGRHAPSSGLAEASVDAVHRIASDPGRLSQRWYDEVLSAGLEPEQLVEATSVVAVVTIADSLARGLGAEPRALPDAQAGQPSRLRPTGTAVSGAWVPMVLAERAEGEIKEIYARVQERAGFVFNVVRALTSVPQALRGFMLAFAPNYRTHGPPTAGGLTRPQMELLASSTSALNDCFY